ncbi:hypothetical protein Q4566_16770 [Tamlana sp. 2_MG-2023]|uniref:hypothetical protein n=1 Tax=unclassified Tamlana TaxID=2614803 RepID=UPI0026E25B1D|nr:MULTISPECIES: hypothetical protein [unclassified Tamlana]MDO6761862.1 hypothetical protein [Tamlana sp. 2_MG-2023]MDO6792633.1 hypothetical protein [Tamlana sp. 1_MG-2023]
MEEVNYIRHLNAVFIAFSKDGRLNPTHISLYIALFNLWNMYHFPKEFYINRQEVMALSKIGSKSTYHRSIKALSHWKYLQYNPSKNKFKGSQVIMFHFGTSSRQEVDSNGAKSGTRSEQEVVSKRKHIQTVKNNTNENKQEYLNFKNFSGQHKRNSSVPYQDNLKVCSDKNYHEPL